MHATRYSPTMCRRGAIFACVAVTACLREPKFEYRDAPVATSDSGGDGGMETALVTAVVSGSGDRGATVTAPGYEVVFSDSGSRFPYQINVGPVGARMVMMGVGNRCNDENGSGIALYPPLAINGEPGSSATTQAVEIVLDGPAVAKVAIDWSASFTCSATTTLGQRTTYTFFPDDRIIRYDRVRVGDSVMPAGCTVCPGGGQAGVFWLTSYTTLRADGATLHNTNPGTVYMNEERDRQGVCLSRLQRQVAFAWPIAIGRVRVAGDAPLALAFIYDFAYAATEMDTMTRELSSAITVGSNAVCGTIAERAEYHATAPVRLSINGISYPPSPDGIYGGEPIGNNMNGGLDLPPGPITLVPEAAGMRDSFAVWLDFGVQPTANVTVERSPPASGTWYRPQRVDGTRIVFWFRDPLQPGETITITPG